MVVLVKKPHHEYIEYITDFMLRMCISYRHLNNVTKPFQFPIPRCNDGITIIECGAAIAWIISLDGRQGYHQVAVLKVDKEKLAFLLLSIKHIVLQLMPFGPTDSPGF